MSDKDVLYALIGVFKRYLGLDSCLDMRSEFRGNTRGFVDEALDLVAFNRTGKKVGSSYQMNDGSEIITDDESVRVYRGDKLIKEITL